MRICIIILLFSLTCFAVAKKSAPTKGYMLKGSHVYICDCTQNPPKSDCEDSHLNACGTKVSCVKLCKENVCSKVACLATTKPNKKGKIHAAIFCNEKNEALDFLNKQGAKKKPKVAFHKVKLSQCGY